MARLAEGALLDEVRIERLLDTGGMGEIYLAEDTRLGRRVAIKVLPEHLAQDESFRRRFERESRIAASLDHPNVVTVYSSGNVDGVVYIAMRYVPGTNLGALMARGRVDRPTLLRILGQVAGALDAAHAIGLVHRDVKPGNILVRGDPDAGAIGEAYLADFGLARDVAGERTTEGHPMGTVHYVAPEQIQEQPTDGRADVYALGCVLFEGLTGRVPYPSEDARAELMAHLTEDPPSAGALDPSLPAQVDEVIRRALAKDPAGRYPGCGALVAAAAEALSHTAPVPVRPDAAPTESLLVPSTGPAPGGTGGSSPPRPRPRWLVPVGAGAGLGVLAVVIALAVGGDPPSPPTDPVHTPGVGAFPNAGERRITDRLQPDVVGCERWDEPATGALEAVFCSSDVQGIVYNLFPNRAQADRALDVDVTTRVETGGDCETDQNAYHGYTDSAGSGGTVACYRDEDSSWLHWTWSDPGDPSLAVYAIAVRTDFDDAILYRWWVDHRALPA
jgi:hypothetical protein